MGENKQPTFTLIHAEGSPAHVELAQRLMSAEPVWLDEDTFYIPSWNDPSMIEARRNYFNETTKEILRSVDWPWWKRAKFRFERWHYSKKIGTSQQWNA